MNLHAFCFSNFLAEKAPIKEYLPTRNHIAVLSTTRPRTRSIDQGNLRTGPSNPFNTGQLHRQAVFPTFFCSREPMGSVGPKSALSRSARNRLIRPYFPATSSLSLPSVRTSHTLHYTSDFSVSILSDISSQASNHILPCAFSYYSLLVPAESLLSLSQ